MQNVTVPSVPSQLSTWDEFSPTFWWRDAGLTWQVSAGGQVSAIKIEDAQAFTETFPGEAVSAGRAAELIDGLPETEIPQAVVDEALRDFEEAEDERRMEAICERRMEAICDAGGLYR